MKTGPSLVLALILAASASETAAQRYSGPPTDSTAYWEVDAYSRYPRQGPALTNGILFWSHGVSGKNVQWKSPPARFIEEFAATGWDVVKINRNNLFENGWDAIGPKHVGHLAELARKAKAEGYKSVIAAGQSYGGAISLEAGAAEPSIDGIIATAPGHGSDSCGSGMATLRIADTLVDRLVDVVRQVKTPRVVITIADGDACIGFNDPSAPIRKALQNSVKSFVFLDKAMPIRGHGAAATQQFSRWYGNCIKDFFDPRTAPPPGETHCTAPSPVPDFLLPVGYEMPRPPANEKSLIGPWSGAYDLAQRGEYVTRNVCLVVEAATPEKIEAKFLLGAGPRRDLGMAISTRRLYRDGDWYRHKGSRQYRMSVRPKDDVSEIDLHIRSADGDSEWEATLKRGC